MASSEETISHIGINTSPFCRIFLFFDYSSTYKTHYSINPRLIFMI